VDRETVGSAQAGRRIWPHASMTSTRCIRFEARRKTRGAALTDAPQWERCRLWRWTPVKLGDAGFRPPFFWCLPRRHRGWAAVGGSVAGTSGSSL
jgi:hypothetical protein